eukprot:gb/GEZN01010358.1/.p1 GENE.gb/GEZN01010358.1/~~gb/GEZN01010358.1/.p1  ORF type:complete len:215 (+),score=52.07 gb/GEZN01010358.1/:31-645(+)
MSVTEAADVQKALRPFYLNLVVLNKDETVKKAVEKKTGTGPFGFGVTGMLGGAIAQRLVGDDQVTAEIAKKLVQQIPAKTKDMGITLDVKTRFQKGSYLVLRARVLHVDQQKLILSAKGQEFADKFTVLLETLEFLGVAQAKDKIEEKVYQKVHDALFVKLGEILPVKLAEEGNVKVVITIKSDQEQAEFFYDFLESLEAVNNA